MSYSFRSPNHQKQLLNDVFVYQELYLRGYINCFEFTRFIDCINFLLVRSDLITKGVLMDEKC
jgi:hypothetical protein